jgi:type III restriction enzyme
VTTIVGLHAYTAKSNILPEQTLGRGLRRMYFGSDAPEVVSVMGTPAFMEFVESIQSEGVTFDRGPMGQRAPSIANRGFHLICATVRLRGIGK